MIIFIIARIDRFCKAGEGIFGAKKLFEKEEIGGLVLVILSNFTAVSGRGLGSCVMLFQRKTIDKEMTA